MICNIIKKTTEYLMDDGFRRGPEWQVTACRTGAEEVSGTGCHRDVKLSGKRTAAGQNSEKL